MFLLSFHMLPHINVCIYIRHFFRDTCVTVCCSAEWRSCAVASIMSLLNSLHWLNDFILFLNLTLSFVVPVIMFIQFTLYTHIFPLPSGACCSYQPGSDCGRSSSTRVGDGHWDCSLQLHDLQRHRHASWPFWAVHRRPLLSFCCEHLSHFYYCCTWGHLYL